MVRFFLLLLVAVSLGRAEPIRGSAVPGATYEAEDMAGHCEKFGPHYDPGLVETGPTGQDTCRSLSPDSTWSLPPGTRRTLLCSDAVCRMLKTEAA